MIPLFVLPQRSPVACPSRPHRAAWVALAILLLTLTTQAQTRIITSDRPQPQGPTGTITGHIYAADTNAPVRFARVSLLRAPTPDTFGGGPMESASTNIDGLFTIPAAPAGTFYIDVAAPGYISPVRAVDNADLFATDPATRTRTLSLVPNVTINGNDSANLEVRLERGAALSGTVYFDDGTPASNLQINAVQKISPTATIVTPGRRFNGFRGVGFQPSRTDDQGTFRLAGLPTGDYIISATFMPDPVRLLNPVNSNQIQFRSGGTALNIYAPRATTQAAATVFSVKAGAERSGVDITLPIHTLHTISGTVSAVSHTITGGQINLSGLDDTTYQSGTSISDDGSFQFTFIPEGRYTLAVSSASDAPPRNFTRGGRPPSQPPSDSFGPISTTVTLHTADATGITLTVPQLPTTAQQ